MRDMDHVITTRELARWAKEEGIDFQSLEDSAYDRLMGEASGAGVIFGNTGGVMEAALRTAYTYITGENAPKDFYTLKPVRGYDGIREASLEIAGMQINVAAVHGTQNARKIIERVKEGTKEYHFIEVMTCPGGCIGGGGRREIWKQTPTTYAKPESPAVPPRRADDPASQSRKSGNQTALPGFLWKTA